MTIDDIELDRMEEEILNADTGSIRHRWEFGRMALGDPELTDQDGRLKHDGVDALITALAEDGAFFNASRILDHTLSYPDATPSHRETARLLSLHTELYADRGSAIAAGDIAPAISVLVKTMTGLSAVDLAAYLRQAEELEASNAKSMGNSHPEAFLRARA